jgi:hypothetical protein
MASDISYKKQPIPKAPRSGEKGRMTKGTGWRLMVVKGQKRFFVGTLLYTYNIGPKRLALFSVPK